MPTIHEYVRYAGALANGAAVLSVLVLEAKWLAILFVQAGVEIWPYSVIPVGRCLLQMSVAKVRMPSVYAVVKRLADRHSQDFFRDCSVWLLVLPHVLSPVFIALLLVRMGACVAISFPLEIVLSVLWLAAVLLSAASHQIEVQMVKDATRKVAACDKGELGEAKRKHVVSAGNSNTWGACARNAVGSAPITPQMRRQRLLRVVNDVLMWAFAMAFFFAILWLLR